MSDDNYSPAEYDLEWREEALCKDTETNEFFPFNINKKNAARIKELITTCHQCPVETKCLFEAVSLEYDGIWGGTTPKQRAAWVRMMKKDGVKNITLEHCEDFLAVNSNPKTNNELGE